jgi:hypothetical protein
VHALTSNAKPASPGNSNVDIRDRMFMSPPENRSVA